MVKPITPEVVKEKLAPYIIHYGAVPAAKSEPEKPSGEEAKPAEAGTPASEAKPSSPR
jgi:hypothetical protein